MKKTILTLISFTILIGVVAIAINTAFGNQTIMFLEKQQINIGTTHFYIWKYDFWKYLTNLQMATSNLSVLVFELPTRQWNNNMDWNALGNNLLVMLDYIILIVNIILYPLKIGAYLLQNILAILGVNADVNSTRNGLAWLVRFITEILGNIAIPYI